MAYFQGTIRSKTLAMDTSLNIIIPYDYYGTDGSVNQCDKTLILLHGLKQNASAWPRMSSCEHFANLYGYNIIIPEVQRSFYTNMAYGLPYFTYITKELPEVASRLFNIPMDPDHLYIGGLSMGGYGALKSILTYPECFKGAMCFSSGFFAFENDSATLDSLFPQNELMGVLGKDLVLLPSDDLEALTYSCAADNQRPEIYISCGTEDFLYQNNIRMKNLLESLRFPLLFEQWQGGHTWAFWNQSLQRAMMHFNKLPLAPLVG